MHKIITKIFSVKLLAIIFWLAIWEITARLVGHSFILPSVSETLISLAKLSIQSVFWITIARSIFRIALGFVLGTLVGIVLGCIAGLIKPFDAVFSPLMVVLRSTPVASFIMVLWFFIGSGTIPTVIALFMVMPIIWQNTTDGINGIDRNMLELSRIYRFSLKKKISHVYFPALKTALLPAIITSSGLAWKAGIAAEIITYTKNSIGANISDAKNFFEGAEMMAWTMTVILLSLAIEALIKRVGRRSS
jgi:NitT/TauT family transport system permease protein